MNCRQPPSGSHRTMFLAGLLVGKPWRWAVAGTCFLSLPPPVFSPLLHPSDSFRPFPTAVLPVKGLAMNSGCASALWLVRSAP